MNQLEPPAADQVPVTPWSYEGAPAGLGHASGVATLVEGQTFCLSRQNGDIDAGRAHGLFVFDTRVLSGWTLTVDDVPLESLAVDLPSPFQATFVTRVPPAGGQADSSLIALRRRSIGNGMREELLVRNVGLRPVKVRVTLRCGADFANLFEVKEGRAETRDAPTERCTPTLLVLGSKTVGDVYETHVRFSEPARVEPGRATWDVALEPGAEHSLCIAVSATVNGEGPPLRFECGQVTDATLPTERLTQWRQAAPVMRSDSASLDRAVRRGIEDLGALRIFDPAHTERPIVAAGAPWFMALFGRDSVLTAWMSLLVDPDLAIGVAETLAALQGRDVDPTTEEQPGRILHEARLSSASGLSLHGGAPYYGSIDSTPLFVMLVGELARWGVDDAIIDRMLPHVDAALEWIDAFGDRDGDGYVEYQRATPDGLANQGWKDSWDGIRFADSRLAATPIALCEAQGYVYAAFRARADLAALRHDADGTARWNARAEQLRVAFNRDFWLADRGWYALGLDADKRPIDALASNMGHALWTGIVDPRHAATVADQLLAPEMFSGWGLRTLATTMTAYNPVSYHNGSVWPHDTAIAAAGLMRYGHVEQAHRLIAGLIDASDHQDGRLPELFSGLARHELGVPVPYPTSCSPQAWAAAAPLLMVRTMLRLDPEVPTGRVWLSPTLPPTMRELSVEGIAAGERRISVHIDGSRVEIEGAAGLDIVSTPRPLDSA